MDYTSHIPTELIQVFSARQANDNLLVPYGLRNGILLCFGETGRDYSGVIEEQAVLYDRAVEVTSIESGALRELLLRYYGRGIAPEHTGVNTISYGQGFLNDLISEAYSGDASDIHLEAYEDRCRIRMRIDGKLAERYVVEKENYTALVNQIKILSNLDISERRLPQDGRLLFNRDGVKFDVRVSCLPAIYGEKVVLRLLTRPVQLLELANLGFTQRQFDDYNAAISNPHGMILICGPTGSGKSTTLYATLRKLNCETNNILTIEDPVEYTLEGVNQVQLKEEIGLTFSSALRTFLRQDPDIIMLGEIRDPQTAQMAVRSSLTGHLVLSTIHTNTAWGSVARLIDMGIDPYLISSTLVMCVSQRLVRLLCPHCKTKGADGCYEAVGCEQCYYTGYRGRRAIYEVIPVDETLSKMIRTSSGDVERYLAEHNITTLGQAADVLLKSGATSKEEVLSMLMN